MIRIWKGPEMEGTKVGIQTLFICSDIVIPIKYVISQLEQNRDVRRIYFGAGKHRFAGVDDWTSLYNYLFRRSIEVIVEVSFEELRLFIDKYDNLITTFIVVNYDMPYTYNNLQFKTDDNKVVTMFNAVSQTSLQTLKENNLFTCDTMLYEED